MIRKDLKEYIETTILPEYDKNDSGHNLVHIMYVIKRSFKFAKTVPEANLDMVYTIAAYHDIGHHIDAKNHEKVSADMLLADSNLKKFFSDEEIKVMAEAVADHRASSDMEPRSIYGKIVSSADRNTSLDAFLQRTYSYRLEHSPHLTLDEIIEESREHMIDKFGKNGYGKEKMYFEDEDFQKFLDEVSYLGDHPKEFRKRYIKVNQLKGE